MSSSHIPVVDFQSCGLQNEVCSRQDLAAMGEQLVHAFASIGFVYLRNHGITDSYVQEVNKVTEKFFTCKAEEKCKYKRKGDSTFGWIAMGEENPTDDPTVPRDCKEAFNVDSKSFQRDPYEWPDELAPGFSFAMLDFMKHARLLSLRILRALAVGLNLKDENFFDKCHAQMHTAGNGSTSKTLYYPALPDAILPGQFRVGEHADVSTITLVFQDNVGGLQAKGLDGEYVDATPIEGTVVVNVGDILEHMTNFDLKSTVHRVIVTEGEAKSRLVRRSLVYFVNPDNDVIINRPLEYNDESRNKNPANGNDMINCQEWVTRRLMKFWEATKEDV